MPPNHLTAACGSDMKLYIETVGCQMNELDSELVVASLRKDGYGLPPVPRADTPLNCSVRRRQTIRVPWAV